ncbi:hypothetical protein BH23VER1_BH23VER1_35470 [soil metagenome]
MTGDEQSGAPKIAVILGHPRSASFCAALADAYCCGAREAGATVRLIRLAEVSFAPDVVEGSPRDQAIEPGLQRAMDALVWADHLVFVYPTWWATMPALLKGFLDRALVPGFAFRPDERAPTGYVPLLQGRSAQLVTTMDSPGWVYRFVYGRAGDRAMKAGILGFCGIRPVQSTWITRLKHRSPGDRRHAIGRMRALGAAAPGLVARVARNRRWVAWLKIMRLQFYAMTLLSYGLGAAAAAATGHAFSWPVILSGFGCLFVLELTSVLLNEIHDQPTDRRNLNAGPFSGGSRVLVEGALPVRSVRSAARMTVVAAAALAALTLLQVERGSLLAAASLLGVGFLLGPGYTAPPLKLVYRGFGEWVVAFTHSSFMLLCGWVFCGGALLAPLPWLLSAPLFVAIFASITLAGIPDADADRHVHKRTLAVLLSPPGAVWVAVAATVLAWASLWGFRHLLIPGESGEAPLAWALFAAHGGILAYLLGRFLRRGAPCRRIDATLAVALSFVLWFSVWPLVAFL